MFCSDSERDDALFDSAPLSLAATLDNWRALLRWAAKAPLPLRQKQAVLFWGAEGVRRGG